MSFRTVSVRRVEKSKKEGEGFESVFIFKEFVLGGKFKPFHVSFWCLILVLASYIVVCAPIS